jgi:hypothetical protein
VTDDDPGVDDRPDIDLETLVSHAVIDIGRHDCLGGMVGHFFDADTGILTLVYDPDSDAECRFGAYQFQLVGDQLADFLRQQILERQAVDAVAVEMVGEVEGFLRNGLK